MITKERLTGLVIDLERIASNLSDGDALNADDCAAICADIAAEFRALLIDGPSDDARLIAAAPDMLAVLQTLARDGISLALYAQARAAIDKATQP